MDELHSIQGAVAVVAYDVMVCIVAVPVYRCYRGASSLRVERSFGRRTSKGLREELREGLRKELREALRDELRGAERLEELRGASSGLE